MDTPPGTESTRGQRFAWCLYDFANSAFPTVIVTAVYVLYFKGVVVGGAETGRSDNLWGMANSIAALVVFAIAPFLGAVADTAGCKRSFLVLFSAICVIATASLYFTGPGTVATAMIVFIVAAVGFEGACVFYNAFLPELVSAEKMGRLSGKGWALGYLGGLGCLVIALALVDNHISLTPPAVALWYLVFALPAFLLLRDKPRLRYAPGAGSAPAMSARRFMDTWRNILGYRRLTRFLVAYFFYNNAVMTIIVFAVAFSADTLAFTTRESILLVVVMNVIASPGAFFFGRLADRVGAKRTLVVTLVMWLAVVAGAEIAAWPGLFTTDESKDVFWGVAALASLCIGAVQATSRTFIGQLAPAGRSGEFFGFMAFAGKGSAVLGPLVFGLTSDIFDSQRAAVLSIGVFFLIGLVLLVRVKPAAPANKGGER